MGVYKFDENTSHFKQLSSYLKYFMFVIAFVIILEGFKFKRTNK